jgi:hypothetical protein
MSPPGLRPDWRLGDSYRPLLAADRSLIAWEWLRRDPSYQVAARAAAERPGGRLEAGVFGLHRFEDPSLTVPEARPLWTREACPFVAVATATEPRGGEEAFDLKALAPFASLLSKAEGGEHILLSDGQRAIRLDVRGVPCAAGPVSLVWHLVGLCAAEPSLLALRRVLAFWRRGRFSGTLHPPEPRARRWVQLLRAADGLADGATHREIAQVLLGRRLDAPGWRTEAPSLRLQAQRLARGARLMAAGKYRRLLVAGGLQGRPFESE